MTFCRAFSVILVICTSVYAQEYLWPTDASNNLTSSFAESRPRRFHAGIDIKTWGQTGYKVFATRDGFIKRMLVSPYGYGRALYLELDTGETVVYAHLERFNDELQGIAEREQERKQAYRIDKHFVDGALPVKQGQLIAFTGRTGIGVPHLHFEMRDRHGRPINPLAKGFKIQDTIRPTIRTLYGIPLEPGAMVQGEFQPVALPLERQGSIYQLATPVRIAGKVGFAVEAFDQANGVSNRFSVYRYRLLIDEHVQFQAQFDRFAYGQNKLIELAQDFALARRGQGRLFKLYRERDNSLPFYSSLNSADGAVFVPMYQFTPEKNGGEGLSGTLGMTPHEQSDAGAELSWGTHALRIVLNDYHGNSSIIEGELLAGTPFAITAEFSETGDNFTRWNRLTSSDGRVIAKVSAATVRDNLRSNGDLRWQAARTSLSNGTRETLAGAFAPHQDSSLTSLQAPPFESSGTSDLIVYHQHAAMIKLVAVDEHGIESFPYFFVADSAAFSSEPQTVEIQKEFWPQTVIVDVVANQPFAAAPRIEFDSNGFNFQPQLLPRSPLHYFGVIRLADLAADSVRVRAHVQSLNNEQMVFTEVFANRPISPERGGTLNAVNGKMQVEFSASSLYWPIYGRIEILDEAIADQRVTGPIYEVQPFDALLSRSATVKIQLPEVLLSPEKYGICYADGDRWKFIDNKFDEQENMITASVLSLERFAIMRDDVPPEIRLQAPAAGDSVITRRPKLVAHVKDTTSGFESEQAIVMKLDGQPVIAEYDPEEDIVFYFPKQDLSPGEHFVEVSAIDRCKNSRSETYRFYIR